MAAKKKTKKNMTTRRAKAKKPAKKGVRVVSKKTVKKKTVKKATKRTARKTVKRKTSRTPGRAVSSVSETSRMPVAVSKRKDQLRKILMKKRTEVVEGLEARIGEKLMRETGQKIDSAMDTADQSAQDVDQVIDYSLLEMKYEQYKDIADAIRKLDNDTYGLCEECGNEISIKRLEVAPLARYCIDCKKRKEELEKIQKEETRFKE